MRGHDVGEDEMAVHIRGRPLAFEVMLERADTVKTRHPVLVLGMR